LLAAERMLRMGREQLRERLRRPAPPREIGKHGSGTLDTEAAEQGDPDDVSPRSGQFPSGSVPGARRDAAEHRHRLSAPRLHALLQHAASVRPSISSSRYDFLVARE
jgi:hypothetical protein